MAIPQPNKIRESELQLDIVQGLLPDSKNEYYVALALDQLGIEYRFQVPLGVFGVRGSQVIDFVVYNPHPVAVFIQGEYWHDRKSESEDTLKQAAAERYYGRGNVVLLMGEETDTPEKALEVVKEKL